MLADEVAIRAGSHAELDVRAGSATRRGQTAETDRSVLPRRFGDYELLEELGRGGMGVVYKARQTSLDRIVALKMILRGATGHPPSNLRRLPRRGQVGRPARSSAHRAVFDEVGETRGSPIFSMRFIEGTTLGAGDWPTGPLDGRRRRRCSHRSAARSSTRTSGRAAPRSQAVEHPDRRRRRRLVTDFGLAKRVDIERRRMTHTGRDPRHAQLHGPGAGGRQSRPRRPGERRLQPGAILYQMLTGRPPFQAASPVDTVLLVLEQDPLPPRIAQPARPIATWR